MKMTQNKNIYNKFRQVSNETFPTRGHLSQILCQDGTCTWTTNHPQRYNGQFFNNTLHGTGTYIWNIDRAKYVFEGKFYSNKLEGYGRFSYPDGQVFEGLFKDNNRFGPGVLTYPDGTQDVGIWKGPSLIRLTRNLKGKIPVLAKTVRGQSYLLQYKALIPLDITSKSRLEQELDNIEISKDFKEIIHMLYDASKNNPKGLLFNKQLYDENYLENDCDYTVEIEENIDGSIIKKEILVTDLLAWNNDPFYLALMKHSFLNRNMENTISFSVQEILNGRSKMFRDAGQHEQQCLDFFTACANENDIDKYIYDYELHRNLSDGFGNAGITYAAVYDNVQIIRALAKCGINFNHINDECLTPLLICLLRYIALKNNVTSWEKAFLPPEFAKLHQENIQEWRKRDLEHLQILDTNLQSYLFDLSCVRVVVLSKGKTKKNDKKPKDNKKNAKKMEVTETSSSPVEVDPREIELEGILKTIVTLLCYGADGNFGQVPLPPIFLSLFTQKPAILGHLIKFGANCNMIINTPEKLTPLHVLCSMTPVKELIQMADILLRNGADTSQRASQNHWCEEKMTLVANYDVEDLGKTPLHLLAMRWDHENDMDDVFGSIFMLFVRYEANFVEKYLGHTALSLAILRGNNRLINKMLNSRKIDVNQELGNNMGFPLTVLVLKRYSSMLPLGLGKNVIDTLLSHHANPFLVVPNDGKTAYEFVIEDNHSEEGKKKEKINKDHVKLLNHFKASSADVLLRHIQGRVIKFLYNNKFKNRRNHHLYDIVVNFVNIHETVNILQTLITYRGIRAKSDLCLNLLEYVLDSTTPTKPKQSKKPTKKENTSSEFLEKLDLEKRKYTFFEALPPEIDTPEKYRVCFECLEKTNKDLVACPKCKLVYFCSTQCNNLNNKKNETKHPCKLLFYDSELENMKKLLESGQQIDDEFQDIIPTRKVAAKPSFDLLFKHFHFDYSKSDTGVESDSEINQQEAKEKKSKLGKKDEGDNDDDEHIAKKKKKKGKESNETILESGSPEEKSKGKLKQKTETSDDAKGGKTKKGKKNDKLKSLNGSSDSFDSKQIRDNKTKKRKEKQVVDDMEKEKKRNRSGGRKGSGEELDKKKLKKDSNMKLLKEKNKRSQGEKSDDKNKKHVFEKTSKDTKEKSLKTRKETKEIKVKEKLNGKQSQPRKALEKGQTKTDEGRKDKIARRCISVDRKLRSNYENKVKKRDLYSKSDSQFTKKELTVGDKVSMDELGLISRRYEERDLFKFKEKILCCVLSNGQLYYKVNSDNIFCKFNYSLV